LTIPTFSKYDIDDAVSHVSAAVDSRSGAWIREVLSQVTPQHAYNPPMPNARRDPSRMDDSIWSIWEKVCRLRPNSESPVLGRNRNSYYAIFCVMLLKVPFRISKSVHVIACKGVVNFLGVALQHRNEPAAHALLDSGLINLNVKRIDATVRFPLHEAIRCRVSVDVFRCILDKSIDMVLNDGEHWVDNYTIRTMVPWTPLLLLIDNIRFYKNRIVNECQCIQLLLKRVCMEDPSAGLHLTEDVWLRVGESIKPNKIVLPLSKEEFENRFRFQDHLIPDLVFSPREFLALTARELVSPYDNSALLIKTPPLDETETDIITETLELLRRIPEEQKNYPALLMSLVAGMGGLPISDLQTLVVSYVCSAR
jgi:hypothetical protein